MPQRLLRLAPLLLVCLLTVLVYVPALGGGFFFDDIYNIVKEGTVKLPALTPAYLLEAAFPLELGSNMRPLSRLSFALNWYASGMDPFAFKLVNLSLHGLNAVLVFLFLQLLLGLYQSKRTGASLPSPRLIAVIAALLWAVAPIHANTVPYVVQRMVLLSATFSLIALIGYLKLRLSLSNDRKWPALAWACLAGASALFSALSKEIAVLLPLYVFVMEATLLSSVEPNRIKRLRSLVAISAIGLPILALGSLTFIDPNWLARAYSYRPFGPWERLLTETGVMVMYLRNTVLPDLGQINFFYDNLDISRSLLSPPTTLLNVTLLGSLLAGALLTRRRWPLIGFAVLWFLGGHLLESTVIPLELVFWHRNYLPSIGPLVVVAWGLAWLLTYRGRRHQWGFVLAGLIAIVFAGQTLILAYTWGAPERMAFAERTENPTSSRANYEAGRQAFALYEAHHERRYLDESAAYFVRAAELDPVSLLPLYALFKLQTMGVPAPFDTYKRMRANLEHEPLQPDSVVVLSDMGNLSLAHPDKLDFFDVLALYDALDQNPRISRRHKARALVRLADFLTASGLPVTHGLTVLRDTRCRAPNDFGVRIRLLEGLTASGHIEEGEELLASGFSPMEKRLSVSLEYAALQIADAKVGARERGAVQD